MAKAERDVLEDVRVSLGLSPADATALACASGFAKMRVGPTPAEHETLLDLMVRVVAADGELAKEERVRITAAARAIGLSASELEARLEAAFRRHGGLGAASKGGAPAGREPLKARPVARQETEGVRAIGGGRSGGGSTWSHALGDAGATRFVEAWLPDKPRPIWSEPLPAGRVDALLVHRRLVVVSAVLEEGTGGAGERRMIVLHDLDAGRRLGALEGHIQLHEVREDSIWFSSSGPVRGLDQADPGPAPLLRSLQLPSMTPGPVVALEPRESVLLSTPRELVTGLVAASGLELRLRSADAPGTARPFPNLAPGASVLRVLAQGERIVLALARGQAFESVVYDRSKLHALANIEGALVLALDDRGSVVRAGEEALVLTPDWREVWSTPCTAFSDVALGPYWLLIDDPDRGQTRLCDRETGEERKAIARRQSSGALLAATPEGFLTTDQHLLRATDPSGSPLWTITRGGRRPLVGLAASGSTVLVATAEPRLIAFGPM